IRHGYMLTGVIINVTLLGVMIAQCYIYYTTYKRDRAWIKLFAAFLFLADVANSVVIYAYIYRVLVLGFGDFENLFVADWVFAAGPATTTIIGLSVQLFFAWRIRILTQQWWRVSWILVGVVCATSVTSAVAGLVTSWNVSRYPRFDQFQKTRNVVSTWLASSAACDALITASLVTALKTHKTGSRRSDFIVDRIIRLTVQTGMITMIVAVIDMILFLVSLTCSRHLVFLYTLSKLYTNSLLSSLNAR
ncbi:hypothetical protein BKA70DRAFT_1057668, partial [Coprinopsis sp. MPI-PUGE-AT-0042]